MKAIISCTTILVGLCSSTFAYAGIQPGDVYQQIGTQGIGIGYAMPLTSWAGVHADINGGRLSHSFSAGSMKYEGHMNLLNGGAYFDAFPFSSSSFRLTAGLIFNDDYVSGNGVTNGSTVTINGTSYAAAGQSVHTKVSYPAAMPYFGVGFGHGPVAKRGFGLTADLGIAYGKPHVDYSVSDGLVQEAGASNVAAETQKISDSVKHHRFYPIVQIGGSYHF